MNQKQKNSRMIKFSINLLLIASSWSLSYYFFKKVDKEIIEYSKKSYQLFQRSPIEHFNISSEILKKRILLKKLAVSEQENLLSKIKQYDAETFKYLIKESDFYYYSKATSLGIGYGDITPFSVEAQNSMGYQFFNTYLLLGVALSFFSVFLSRLFSLLSQVIKVA